MDIDVVIVTYNRIEKLKKAILAFEEQTLLPKRIVIVDNNSTDGTRAFLEKWSKEQTRIEKIIINLENNIGGAGGFAKGTEFLINIGAEWIWVSDDDAYPDKNALYVANNYLEKNNNENISAICGQVISEGKTLYAHRGRNKKGLLFLRSIPSTEIDYQKEQFEIDIFSYVGTILNAKKVKEVGTINKDFFIYYDDVDHAIRLRKVGNIICIPEIKVTHDIKINTNDNACSWKTYYLFRNQLYYIKWNFEKRYLIMAYLITKIRILKRILLRKNKKEIRIINDAVKDFKKRENRIKRYL